MAIRRRRIRRCFAAFLTVLESVGIQILSKSENLHFVARRGPKRGHSFERLERHAGDKRMKAGQSPSMRIGCDKRGRRFVGLKPAAVDDLLRRIHGDRPARTGRCVRLPVIREKANGHRAVVVGGINEQRTSAIPRQLVESRRQILLRIRESRGGGVRDLRDISRDH